MESSSPDDGTSASVLLLSDVAARQDASWGIVTRDTDEPLNELLLRVTKWPVVLACLAYAESGVEAHSERYQPNCDKSGGLFHQSVCYVSESEARRMGLEGARYAGKWPATRENYERLLHWYWQVEHACEDAGPRLDALMAEWYEPLEALCRWNKPALPGIANPNRGNYARALAQYDDAEAALYGGARWPKPRQ